MSVAKPPVSLRLRSYRAMLWRNRRRPEQSRPQAVLTALEADFEARSSNPDFEPLEAPVWFLEPVDFPDEPFTLEVNGDGIPWVRPSSYRELEPHETRSKIGLGYRNKA
ncbi:MAG: hypothetical protein [Microviridae sp.]|nr:MAG: hypothetical protein [Microviridae sp.]